MSNLFMRPGLRLGSYPQHKQASVDELEALVRAGLRRFQQLWKRPQLSLRSTVGRIEKFESGLEALSESDLTTRIQQVRHALHRDGLKADHVAHAFALTREASWRVLGKRHFDVQLQGGWLMMYGYLAEMQTGEGKTLAAALPSCTAGLAGIPTHIVTANDYLAERDCEILSPLYERLGLTFGSVITGMSNDECREVYARDIVHTTNKQLAFDYLRDRIEIGDNTGRLGFELAQLKRRRQANGGQNLLLRGLCFAIVDEADSVLIDEANTPLIITKPIENTDPSDIYGDGLYLASRLVEDIDYVVLNDVKSVSLLPKGEETLAEAVSSMPSWWTNERRRNALIEQALRANYFYLKERDYVVKDDKVQIIDQATGRLMPDRSWERGLHQIIEAKEGCIISEPNEPVAKISYQKFFARYMRLGGTSGTVHEVSSELRRVYDLEVRTVATHQPSKRRFLGETIYLDQQQQQHALIERVQQLSGEGRPILIGTCSVDFSEVVSGWLKQAEIEHRVLNAKQDHEEASIIARAGEVGAITVATNMAGRGTDIPLSTQAEMNGGLHVISTSLNSSYRVDRQLFGRCARQGNPGSAEAILSFEDQVIAGSFSPTILKVMETLAWQNGRISGVLCHWLLRRIQNRNERSSARSRKQVMLEDTKLKRTLAFAGKFE